MIPTFANGKCPLISDKAWKNFVLPANGSFDDLMFLATQVAGCSAATLCLLDGKTLRLHSKHGPIADSEQVLEEIAQLTLKQSETIEVSDLSKDKPDSPYFLSQSKSRFFAGFPIFNGDGLCLGVFSLLHSEPKQLTNENRRGLQILAQNISEKLDRLEQTDEYFDVSLDIDKNANSSPALLDESQSTSLNLKKVRILVAEDNTTNQIIALRMLNKLGFDADVVANGLEVLKVLCEVPYDLILMDCQMPEMDGYEATKLIRESQTLPNPHIPILALTSNAMAEDAERCFAAGMDGHIPKPVPFEKLASILHSWLDKTKSRSAS